MSEYYKEILVECCTDVTVYIEYMSRVVDQQL